MSDAIHASKSDKNVKEVGIEPMINQCKELVDFGAPVLHFYTMGNPEQLSVLQGKYFSH